MPSDHARGTLGDAKAAVDVRTTSTIGLALSLGLGGCAWDAPMSTVAARSDVAREILHVYAIITWIAVGIALVVGIALAWVVVRFRSRPGAPGMPAQIRGHTLLEISWTIAPAIVLLVIAIPTIQVIFRTQAAPPRDALQVRVLGHQWWWEFRYPALEVVTANELHVPAGRPVALTLDGPDVIHSFWVPMLGGKRDVVPGRLNRLTFTVETSPLWLLAGFVSNPFARCLNLPMRRRAPITPRSERLQAAKACLRLFSTPVSTHRAVGAASSHRSKGLQTPEPSPIQRGQK